jgi:CRISPR/Cas system-associated exonuclease Cas4 (RecB family)
MKTIRASEISSYFYCQRAWWLQTKGHIPENQTELSAGKQIHASHGRVVLKAGCIQIAAYTALICALILLVVHLTLLYFS